LGRGVHVLQDLHLGGRFRVILGQDRLVEQHEDSFLSTHPFPSLQGPRSQSGGDATNCRPMTSVAIVRIMPTYPVWHNVNSRRRLALRRHSPVAYNLFGLTRPAPPPETTIWNGKIARRAATSRTAAAAAAAWAWAAWVARQSAVSPAAVARFCYSSSAWC